MPITNPKQALAQELIERLGDKKKKAFGLYCGLIKKYGRFRIRSVMSEVVEDYRLGKITNKAKVFMYRIKNELKVENKQN